MPLYGIHGENFNYVDHGKVVSIEEVSISDTETVGWMSTITFEDGAMTSIENCLGYITTGHWEERDDR